MNISYKWLQTYFKEELPAPEKLAELFTFHAFEVESLEKAPSGDSILDIKVLPDRAHYALSHKGIALETSLVTGFQRIIKEVNVVSDGAVSIPITVEDPLCRRYMGRVVQNITVGNSPVWLTERLEAVGQRSINSIVDVTNYIMLDIGQPLHAFDLAKVKGGITVRKAKEGETMVTLDQKEVKLTPSMLVVADDQGPLAIAGVKGGNRAGVTAETKDIILESANFDAGSVRRTSTALGIRTDSSKRFENNLSPEVAEEGLNRASALIKELSSSAVLGVATDHYPMKEEVHILKINLDDVNKRLGLTIPEESALHILQAMEITVTKEGNELSLSIPLYRQDLGIFEDIVEEIGRIYGYEKISPVLPSTTGFKPHYNKFFYYTERIKDILVAQGFSETYLYTFGSEGVVEVAKPLASDKKFLRTELSPGIAWALEYNGRNSDLLGLDQIKIFEIGSVFTEKGESVSLALGAQQIKKVKGVKATNLVEEALSALEKGLGITLPRNIHTVGEGAVSEYAIDALTASLPAPENYDALQFGIMKEDKYKPFSVYPFVSRDIAVFVPVGVEESALIDIIQKEGGELLVHTRLFDVFTKDAKTSYAFRLVFQSSERTLVETEVATIINNITAAMNAHDGWMVR